MNNIKQLKTSQEIKTEMYLLGDFVLRYINGCLEQEFDLTNPCGHCDIIASNLIPRRNTYSKAYLYNGAISIIYNDGTIVEIRRSPRKYYTREEATTIIDKIFSSRNVIYEKVYHNNRKKYEKKNIIKEEAIVEISNYYGQGKIKYKDIIVNDYGMSFTVFNSKMFCFETINILAEDKQPEVNKDLKIIQSKKFKAHMQSHADEFYIPYQALIEYMVNNGTLNDISGEFVQKVVEFPFYIGNTTLCETDDTHEIVYARRKNRDIYTRFTLNGELRKTNKCVVVLKRSNTNHNEYYLITMFPGEHLVKEPQDRNFEAEESRQAALQFWSNHALVFEPKTIDLESVRYICPYNDMFIMG